MIEDGHDPDAWEAKATKLLSSVSGRGRTMAEYESIDAPLKAIYADQLAAAKTAFPWVEGWFEDDDQFFALLRERMTDHQAQTIKTLRGEQSYTWRAIAEWAYENLRRTWRLGWTQPANQEVGNRICDTAARGLGDDPHADPW